jgi:hypothetical protein
LVCGARLLFSSIHDHNFNPNQSRPHTAFAQNSFSGPKEPKKKVTFSTPIVLDFAVNTVSFSPPPDDVPSPAEPHPEEIELWSDESLNASGMVVEMEQPLSPPSSQSTSVRLLGDHLPCVITNKCASSRPRSEFSLKEDHKEITWIRMMRGRYMVLLL